MVLDEAYREAEKKIEEARRSGATELDLSGMKLTELPESIGQLNHLQRLDLGRGWQKGQGEDNRLTTLPKVLEQLKQLQELDLSHNQMKALPSH